MTTLVHVGETLTGRITDTIPVVAMRWADVLNQNGSIEITVTEDVIRATGLRQRSHGMRTFLAVEVDGRIKQAGPITSRGWDWKQGQATFGAQGIWRWLDERIIRPTVLADPIQKSAFTVTGKSLGGIARALVAQAISEGVSTALPIVLPDDESGDHTETFPLWQLPRYGEQLRQITQRAIDAPDIHFSARRREDDARYIEWVMEVGTEVRPALSQVGADWVFDASAPKPPVQGISTDEDPAGMAQQVYVTGNGMEEDILFSVDYDSTLVDLGWPLTDADESRSTVEEQDTLDGHAASFLARVARPIEVFKVHVDAAAAREVLPGDYCRVITRGDAWLGAMDKTMRVKQVSGDLTDTVVLDMFPLQADL